MHLYLKTQCIGKFGEWEISREGIGSLNEMAEKQSDYIRVTVMKVIFLPYRGRSEECQHIYISIMTC